MIKIQDWIASIPEEEKHIAYVGEGMTEQREFLLCGEGWEQYKDYGFHLDMAFDPVSITTRDCRQVVQTTVNSAEHKEEAGVTKDAVTTKETYTVCDEEVLGYDLTDVAPLDKWVEKEGIRLIWTVLRQHTQLPGKLKATIRAVGEEPDRIKKSAMMVFEVEPSVAATPAAVPPISEFAQMEAQMDVLRQGAVEAAQEAMQHATTAASAASGAAAACDEAMGAADAAQMSADTAVSAASGAVQAQHTAADHAALAEQYRGAASAEANTAVSACADAKNQAQTAAQQAQAAAQAQAMAAEILTRCGEQATKAETAAEAAQTAKTELEAAVADVADLSQTVFGDRVRYLFNSETDAFGDGGFNGLGAPYADGKHHIPRFDISGEPVTVRIYSYNSNGIAPDWSEHALWICQYDADGNIIDGTRQYFNFYAVDEDGNVGGQDTYYTNLLYIERAYTAAICIPWRGGGVGTITPAEGAKYATIFGIFDGVDLDIKIWAGDEPAPSGLAHDVKQLENKAVELQEQVGELEETLRNFEPELPEQTYNIVDGNEALLGTVFGINWGNYVTDFAALAVADMHGQFVALDDAAVLRDALANAQTINQKGAVILNAGDNINIKAKMNGEINPEVAQYMEKAVRYGVYHTMGQHECGWAWNTTEDGMLKANCMTHEEVFNYFIAPMREVWGLPDLDTIYYYKDFINPRTGRGTRLISLYQYNIPLVDADGDSSRYKYSRAVVWYGQEQLNWLVNTLNTTPDGYKVVILQHGFEKTVVSGDEESIFRDPDTNICPVDSIVNGFPVFDIVQAYIDKTTLNKIYTPNHPDEYPADTFTVSVDADFTNARGAFANYFSGDGHTDFIGYVSESKQRQIALTATSNSSADSFVVPSANDASRSIVILLGYDHTRNCVRLGRVGQQYAMTGQTRVLERVSLTDEGAEWC